MRRATAKASDITRPGQLRSLRLRLVGFTPTAGRGPTAWRQRKPQQRPPACAQGPKPWEGLETNARFYTQGPKAKTFNPPRKTPQHTPPPPTRATGGHKRDSSSTSKADAGLAALAAAANYNNICFSNFQGPFANSMQADPTDTNFITLAGHVPATPSPQSHRPTNPHGDLLIA